MTKTSKHTRKVQGQFGHSCDLLEGLKSGMKRATSSSETLGFTTKRTVQGLVYCQAKFVQLYTRKLTKRRPQELLGFGPPEDAVLPKTRHMLFIMNSCSVNQALNKCSACQKSHTARRIAATSRKPSVTDRQHPFSTARNFITALKSSYCGAAVTMVSQRSSRVLLTSAGMITL